MAKYANQKHCKIEKDVGGLFLQINQYDWQYAFSDLSPTAFGVYLYLAQNKNGYELDYSPQAIANTGLMDRSTAQKKWTELIDKGYIVDGIFYTRPPKINERIKELLTDTSI